MCFHRRKVNSQWSVVIGKSLEEVNSPWEMVIVRNIFYRNEKYFSPEFPITTDL
jgi:hypothetical protein